MRFCARSRPILIAARFFADMTRPFTLIAGPCSAESRAQVLSAAQGLKRAGLDYFRAGIWKPEPGRGPSRAWAARDCPGFKKSNEKWA